MEERKKKKEEGKLKKQIDVMKATVIFYSNNVIQKQAIRKTDVFTLCGSKM